MPRAAKAMAMTAVDLLTQPELLARARAEFAAAPRVPPRGPPSAEWRAHEF